VQAFVQFYEVSSAAEARQALNNHPAFEPLACIHVHYSRVDDLVPKGDNVEVLDFGYGDAAAAQVCAAGAGLRCMCESMASVPALNRRWTQAADPPWPPGDVVTPLILPPAIPRQSHTSSGPTGNGPSASPGTTQSPGTFSSGSFTQQGSPSWEWEQEHACSPSSFSPDGGAEAFPLGDRGPPADGGRAPCGRGNIMLVTGLDPAFTTCDIIRNLFFNFGDVVRIKRLTQKPDHALVEMSDAFSCANAVNVLRGCVLFGRQVKVGGRLPHALGCGSGSFKCSPGPW
jgi:hypothetical protein